MVIFNGLQLLIVGILLNCQFLLTSSKGLTARISPKKTAVLRGEFGVFDCQITGDPLPTITWYNNGKNIMRDARSKIQKIPGGYRSMIRYGKLYRAFHHHGNISCKASNGVDPPAIDTAILNVLNLKDVSLPAGFPKIVARYELYVHVVVGKNVTLVVNITGNPAPKITWFKDKYLVDLKNPRITLLPSNSLHLTNVQLADRGTYDYMAENDKGQKFSRPRVVIPYFNNTAPVFIKGGPEDRVVDPQTNVLINCSATGYPKPNIHWKDSRGDDVAQNDGLLKINNILNSETYKCIAKNVVGEKFKFVKVTVRGIPLAPVTVLAKSKTGSSLTISWEEGNSSIATTSHVVKHRKKGDKFWRSDYKAASQTVWTIRYLNAYTDYEVQVLSKNNFGISKGSIVKTFKTDETAPGTAPRNIVVKAIGRWSFEVSWDPPIQPNGEVISYTIYYTDEPEKHYKHWSPETSVQSPCKIYNRKENHRYAVVISARTAVGSGPLSKHFLVQTVKGAPSEPQNVKTKVLSSSAVQVSWSKPIFNGGGQGIIGYEVYYNVSSSLLNTKVNVQSPDDYSMKVTGLTPYTTYQFAVAAKTDAGSGPISISIFAQTVEDVPSAAPANLTCVAIDANRLQCSWRSPPFHSRNGRIIGYTIRYKAVNQQYTRKNVRASAMSLDLLNLQAYTLYTVDIAAKTLLGEGPFSHPITVTTKETQPFKAPRNIVAEVLNSTAIHVKWQAPSAPFGAKLLGYIVYYRRYYKETNMRIQNTWGNKVDIVLIDLEPETEYELMVAINSAKGSGKVTDALHVITKQSPPPAPILRFHKRQSPPLGVDVSWKSTARDIKEFRLRNAKEVEQIDDATLLKKLTYVENNFSRSVTSYNYTNFGPGLWYLIKLSVRNPGGWSPERKVWVQMKAAKPIGAPLKLTVEVTSSTSLQLSWDLPSKWKRNGEIIGYRLSYKRADATEKKQVKNLDKKTKIKLQDLSKFTTYEFWIRAKTVAGLGPAAEIQETTKQDVPSTGPQITEARGVGTEVVLLRLVPPSEPNGVIIGYKVDTYLVDPKTGAGKLKTDIFPERNIKNIYIGELFRQQFHWFKVAAKTIVGYGPYSAAVSAKTLNYDLPLPVRQLSVSFGESGLVKLTWEKPVSTAAVIKYQISYLGKKNYRGSSNKIETAKDNKIKIVKCCKERFANLNDLVPYTSYVANVTSMSVSGKSESKWINFTTKATSSPPFPKPNITQKFSEDYIPIYLSRASERNGPISHYLVHVASLGTSLVEARKKLQEISKSSSKRRSRREVRKDNKDIYVTAKLLSDYSDVIFNVGEGQVVNGYTNKILTKKHFYAFSVDSCVLDEDLIKKCDPVHQQVSYRFSLGIKIRACDVSCLVTTTDFTDIIQFAENKNPKASVGGSNVENDSKLWLLGPVVAVVFLVIVIVVICLLWRRRVKSKRDKPKHLNKWLHDEQSPMVTTPKDPVEMQRLNLETDGMREHPRIPISELGLHIEELEDNSNDLFTREYESIDPGITLTSEVSARHLNQSKNRYPNIVPYDHTRVMLQETNGFLDSDYINANFMAGYRKQNGYIATQAPLPNTITDFWQMVWEQDTRTIVMMSSLQEKGRIKCDQYWPNRVSEKFGYVSVTVVETVELAHYTIRTFRLCKDGLSDISREVKQFQYTGWPDHGVPHYSTSLLCFIRKVRLSNSPDVGPIVVHCSAGVGRTGVFIVVDSMLERIRREQTVDVYGHVTLLRSQRNHMVQTEDQYIFIHKTLLEAFLFGNTEIQASDLSQYYKKINEIGETETTNIEEQFKLLNSFNHPHRFVTAILPVNKTKNRYPKIVPYEQSKVDLVPTRGVDGSNYINASFIDGYKQRKAYIAAQSPLDETVNDFWRMIMEKKTNIIVMLSETTENGQEMSAEYWPREKSVKYHYYIVDPVSEEETPNFTLRQFKVNDMMSACPTLIKVFQLKKWPERGKPQSCKGILDLIGQVHTAKNNDETKGPVVVHCSSGSGRTGVFCALSIVVERMRAEGLVDLLQTVRHLREQRPQMVETLEEYSFCYETALYYLTSFDHIA